MSPDAAAIVRSALTALNDRDVAAYLACCTHDVELVPAAASFEGAFHGPEGVRRFFDGLDEVSSDFRLQEERLETLPPGTVVLASLRATATGRASGVPAEFRLTNVYELMAGRISRVRVFLDAQEAVAAARSAAADGQ